MSQANWRIFTQFMPLISFDTPWKHKKASGFLMFSGRIKRDIGMKWVNCLMPAYLEYFDYMYILRIALIYSIEKAGKSLIPNWVAYMF